MSRSGFGGRDDGDGGGPGDRERRQRLGALLSTVDDDRCAADPCGDRARLGRVCTVAVSEVGVSGAGITVMGGPGAGSPVARDQVWASNPVTRRLEGLQLSSGEGPCLDAYADGAPVLESDLPTTVRWIGFGPDAVAAGAAAVFSLPLQVGAVRLGTLDLYRDAVGSLSRDELADALLLAAAATEALLDLTEKEHQRSVDAADDDESAEPAAAFGWLPGVHAVVHQASGMVSAREAIRVDAALLRIRGYAYAHAEPIDLVARRVLDRSLTLDEHRADEPDPVPDDAAGHPDERSDGGPPGAAGPWTGDHR